MKTPTKTWTWAALYVFSNAFNTYEVGQEIQIDWDLVHTPRAGEVIRIVEFDRERWKKEGGKNAMDYATGREMVWECIYKKPNTVNTEWGMPRVTKHGEARFKVLSKTVSDSFNPQLLYP